MRSLQLQKSLMNNQPYYLLGLLVGLLLGCNSPDPNIDSESEQASTKTLTKVTLQLNWFPEAEHGGYYAAALHGFFEEEGLEVEILPGGPNSPVIQQLVSSQAEFVVGNADQVLTSRAKDSEAVALFAPLQNSPRCIMVHEAAGIESLADAVMERWFSPQFRATPEMALWRNMLTRQPDAGYAGCSAAISHSDFMTPTSGLRLPALGIAGSEDGSTPPDLVRELIDLIPASKFKLIRRAGHLPCVEQPQEYADTLNDFLASVGHIPKAQG